jgi:Pyruvate/2-oxoglutarate dehydrogenase complex, dihydrolipoamide acyltransferase (E2) component, and related enzymes
MYMNLERDKEGRYYYRLPRSLLSEDLKHPYADYHPRPTYGSISIDMTDADAYKRKLEEDNKIRITFTSMIIKAAAEALEDFPILCGVWEGKDRIRCPDPRKIDIVGPVQIEEKGGFFLIEEANRKTLIGISEELRTQVDKVRLEKKVGYPWPRERGELKPLFEITNPGMMGVESAFTVPRPIATSLLIVCVIEEKPIVRDGQIVVRKMMNAILSIDHYAMLAKIPLGFLNKFKRNLENPSLTFNVV